MADPMNPDQVFERTFSDLAFASLQDSAPQLLQHLVGFQTLDVNDDQTKAVGVFGFKLGKEWVYAPMFFMNGELKGELMYLKNQDMFVPLQENWINYVLGRRPHELGEHSDRNHQDMAHYGADFRTFYESPLRYSKNASVRDCSQSELCGAIAGYQAKKAEAVEFVDKLGGLDTFKDALRKQAGNWDGYGGYLLSPNEDTIPYETQVDGDKPKVEKKARYRQYTVNDGTTQTIPTFGRDNIQAWAEPVRKAAAQSPSRWSTKYAEAAERSDLVNFLSNSGPWTVNTLFGAMKKESKLCDNVTRYYDINRFGGIKFAECSEAILKTAQHGRQVDKTIKLFPDNSYVQSEHTKQASTLPDVVVEYSGGHLEDIADRMDLSNEEKELLMRGEVLVKDKRPEGEVSKVYNIVTDKTCQNPTHTGIHEILTADGNLMEAMVIISPMCMRWDHDAGLTGRPDTYIGGSVGTSDRHTTAVCVIDLKDIGYDCTTSDKVFGHQTSLGPTAYDKSVLDLPAATSMTTGKAYALVDPSGAGTKPFMVKSKSTNEGGQTVLEVDDHLRDPTATDSGRDCVKLVLDEHCRKLTRLGNTVFVPTERVRAVKVNIPPFEKSEDGWQKNPYYEGNAPFPALGNLRTVQQALVNRNLTVPMKLYRSSSNEFHVTVGSMKSAGYMSPRDTLKSLILQHGLTHEKAAGLIKAASTKRAVKVQVVYGKSYPIVDPSILEKGAAMGPTLMYPNYTNDPQTNIPTVSPEEHEISIPQLQEDQGAVRAAYNPDPALDETVQSVAARAAETGQKEVFDTAMMGSLLKTVDSDRMIDKYIGDMMLGLDRVGRVYFLFLQHFDDFNDRYGQDDLMELEDSLLNTFQSMGNLILFLKQKAAGESPSMENDEVKLTT